MNEIQAPSTDQAVGAEMLRGFWYPATLSERVAKRGLIAVQLLGEPLAIGRDPAGRAFALRDVCPHRGMPLSVGRFEDGNVECCYHGWQFEPHTGQCRAVPSITEDSKLKVERIYCGSFPCAENNGYVWVYMPDQPLRGPATADAAAEVPPAPQLETFSERYRITRLEALLPSNVDHGIIGLMDPAHGPFVHQSWWWRSRRSIQTKEKKFEPIPYGFRMSAHKPSANSGAYKLLRIYNEPITTTIDFILPNHRLEVIRCGRYWFSSRTTVTPVTADSCRIDVCAAWNIFPWMPFVVPILRAFAKRFIEQDRLTMERQVVGLRNHPTLMLVDDADRPARWYFQLKKAYLESRRTGQPFVHPIPEPVTLRWRS
jgi:phenylpropionate dioxygenase-like ring-hydroxylating dioxygenase large terminal subunit